MYLSLLPSKALLNDVKYLFLEVNEIIYFWLCWVLVAESESALSLVAVCGLRGLLIAMASLDVERENLPRPGTEPLSPALVSGFLSTVPPGKSKCLLFKKA